MRENPHNRGCRALLLFLFRAGWLMELARSVCCDGKHKALRLSPKPLPHSGCGMSSITKLNRYICGCKSALLLRVCPARFYNGPPFRSSCCLWACTRSPGSWFFTERPRKPPRQLSLLGWHIRSLAGPIPIYRLRYTRAARPTRLGVLRMDEGAISSRFERRARSGARRDSPC